MKLAQVVNSETVSGCSSIVMITNAMSRIESLCTEQKALINDTA